MVACADTGLDPRDCLCSTCTVAVDVAGLLRRLEGWQLPPRDGTDYAPGELARQRAALEGELARHERDFPDSYALAVALRRGGKVAA